MLAVIVTMAPLTVPKLFGYHIYAVLTESMLPAYPVGSIVFIQSCDAQDIQAGDVITYRMGSDTGYVMTHRVTGIDRDAQTFVTKGDANNAEDPEPVGFERLVGKAVLCVPGMAAVSDFVDSSTGKAVLFGVFALALICWITADLLAPKKGGKKAAYGEKRETSDGGEAVGQERTAPGENTAAAEAASQERGSVGENADTAAKRRGKGFLRPVLRVLGILLIVGAAVYLGSVFIGYRAGDREYDALRESVFADAATADDVDTNRDETINGGMEESISESDRRILEAVAGLREENEDVIGWIAFDNMDLSYPVMQGEDNTWYLHHTYSGESNSAGSIFMEAANSPDFEDCHTVIYGHNMRNLSMFGQLRKYREEDFYQDHRFFTVYTDTQVYRYEIFAYYDISEWGDLYTVGFAPNEEFEEFVGEMKQRSYYDTGVEVTAADKVITLSTCSTKGNRFVLNARRVTDE